MNKEKLTELFAKKASGMLTLPEARELAEYLSNNPDQEELATLMDDFLKGNLHFNHVYTREMLDERVGRLQQKLFKGKQEQAPAQKKGLLRTLSVYLSAAAVLVLLAGTAWYFFYSQKKEAPVPKNVLATKAGSKSTVELPDGTRVLLNADTRLFYDQSFGNNTREVTLEGEAYFDVVKDAKHPFIVHTSLMNIKVLGTIFNVRAYKSEENMQATLLRGSVEVTLKKKGDRKILVLKPNEKLIVRNFNADDTVRNKSRNALPDIAIMTVKAMGSDSTVKEAQWTKNRLVFDQSRLEDIIPELERWYGVTIQIKDTSLLNRKISGIYENESLTEVLESFKLVLDFSYKISGNTVTIVK
ncbi:MAG TPA: FecR domain-containing protein [Niabella sp.]